MPGPASGGGSFGGGRGGGSFGGGGYRGGYYGGYHRGPRFGFFPFGFGLFRPYGYYGGGCLGGILGIFLFPIILILIAAIILGSIITNAVSNVAKGGVVSYSEEKFQRYAYEEYFEHFDQREKTFENNILISVLINEERDYGYFIAMTGDNIETKVKEQFRAERGYTFGDSMNNYVQKYYGYSLHGDLASVMDALGESVSSLNLSSPFKITYGVSNPAKSRVVNDSELDLNYSTTEHSLERFTEKTDIPVVIVIDEMEDVFGKSLSAGDVITVILLLVVIGFAIYLIVKNIKNRKSGGGNSGYYNGGGNSDGYSNGYGGNYNNGYNSSHGGNNYYS